MEHEFGEQIISPDGTYCLFVGISISIFVISGAWKILESFITSVCNFKEVQYAFDSIWNLETSKNDLLFPQDGASFHAVGKKNACTCREIAESFYPKTVGITPCRTSIYMEIPNQRSMLTNRI